MEEGALAFFDEKYDHEVRTIKIDAPWSYELCGGTHMDSTGGIGLFKIVSENGIGSGNRRLFATTGLGTEDLVHEKINIVNLISEKLNSNIEDVYEKFVSMFEQNKNQQKIIDNLQQQLTDLSLGNTKSKGNEFKISEVKFSCSKAIASNIGTLRKAGDSQRSKLGKGVAIVGSVIDDKGVIVIMSTDEVKFDANEIAKIIANETNSGGGGNKFSAQVGIKDINSFENFLQNSKSILESKLK
ncbi:MAG: DHHA1 domain-containing protein [Chloroflexota bacterium]|nr:DHHA1 domain-containing protein [Chloroflexota bacterium]